MSTTIEVHKQNICQLLGSSKEHIFVIPEYQRPYAWGIEEVDTLFDDLWDFSSSPNGGSDHNGTYFLGSIVSFTNENGEQEIIDGQQRITSLFLLLRAIYTKLKHEETNTKEAIHFSQQIESAIWRTNRLTGEVNYDAVLLRSDVINNEGNKILLDILRSGNANAKNPDKYTQNYLRFQHKLDEAAKTAPLSIYNFIYALLHQAIILPISADTQNTALTIFSTLNDRGLPLSDADIFKATIYNGLERDEKALFIEKWKDLDELAQDSNESIQKLFYYYMFCLRAREKDSNSTLPGMRKYYAENKSQRLGSISLMEDLFSLAYFWRYVNKRDNIDNEPWCCNIHIQQALDILSSYPNEFWKYPVMTYYLSHRHTHDFETLFMKFLRKLAAELTSCYLLMPTVNAVKTDILKLDVDIIESTQPTFDFKGDDEETVRVKIRNPHKNIVRMLLKILAYQHPGQKSLLPTTWEIEHIFPRKYQASYFPVADKNIIEERIEHIGNKVPLEKKLNITAGNGYFEKKKKEYDQSSIQIAHDLTNRSSWGLDDILERDIHQSEIIISVFSEWKKLYTDASAPTPEQLRQIEEFRSKGWIS